MRGILSRDLLCLFNVSVNEENCRHFPENEIITFKGERFSQVDCNIPATLDTRDDFNISSFIDSPCEN